MGQFPSVNDLGMWILSLIMKSMKANLMGALFI